MKEYPLFSGLKILLERGVLALTSKADMTFVSSAVHNGGLGKAKAVLNVHVPESYDQKLLHEHPEQIISEAARKIGLNPQQSVGMITAADISKFSAKTINKDDLTVGAIVTAGCSLAETAGENVEVSLTVPGTINIIVAIDGNPTESCLLQAFITATEAKTASLRDLDVRSTYTGDLATGTITDSLTVVSTSKGQKIKYGGPASKLGKLVGCCTREAVKDAILKSGNMNPTRSVLKRLSERKIPVRELLMEASKKKHGSVDEVTSKIQKEPLFALVLMMAAEIDEEIRMGLIPEEFGDVNALSERFAKILFKNINEKQEFCYPTKADKISPASYLFLKSLLSHLI